MQFILPLQRCRDIFDDVLMERSKWFSKRISNKARIHIPDDQRFILEDRLRDIEGHPVTVEGPATLSFGDQHWHY